MASEAVTTVTPTGVLVYEGEPVTPEWFAVRREGITGTDLPKILGLSKYGSSLSVWLDKRGEGGEDLSGEAARWGNLLEDIVAREWALRRDTQVSPVGVIAHAGWMWQRASLDRLVHGCPDADDPQATPICGLEVKTRSAYKRGSFKDGEPDDVLAQVLWGRLVTGLDHMHLAVLIGGQELLEFRVDRDPILEQYLVDAAKPVWDAVLDGDPPTAHPDAEGVLLADLNRLYGSRAGEIELPEDADTWLTKYADANRIESSAKRAKAEAKAALVQMLGSGEVGLRDEVPAFTYITPEPSDQVTADSLRALRVDNPELYAALTEDGVITRTDPGPRFNLKRRTTTT